MARLPRITNGEQLAAALGVVPRQLNTYRRRGLPLPAAGESIEAWTPRAKEWLRAHRGRPGPKLDEEGGTDRQKLAHWDWRYRKAKAEKEELGLAVARGEMHSKVACEREDVARYEELRAFFAMLPDRLARRLYQSPSPEAIKVVVEDEVRDAFERFRRARAGAVAPPAEGEDDGDEGAEGEEGAAAAKGEVV